jgi:8-oxo-dGTP pyrophosphatase MutT (NUDIX family)
MDINVIHLLEKRLAQDLPGYDIQNKMAPPLGSDRYSQILPDHKVACVMALLFPKNDQWHLSLIERAGMHPEDKHAGQISFPGGKLDENDASYEDCALRETYEEIGIAPDTIGILGELTPLYVFVSNFLVHPFVGFTTESPRFILQESEVKSIIEIPIEHFTKAKNKQQGDIHTRDIIIPNTPYYDVYGQKLWGATAMMMSELEYVWSEALGR